MAGCCVFAFAIYAWSQGMRAGLWETTSTMTWQKSPFQGMNLPPAAAAAMGGGTHTIQVCVTQKQIDKFGTVPPQMGRECQMTDVKITATGMTAGLTCTSPMAGSGTVSANWSDSSHTSSHAHFSGTMQMGPNPAPVEWTVDATSVYKGADCGSVKPAPEPPGE
jgi:Protein of unknown function (DUF3617)